LASLAALQNDVATYLNRQDILTNGVFPGWVSMVELEIAETLRARCMVTSAYQNIDAAYIALPDSFASMESIRDATTGVILDLKDSWSGNWTDPQQDDRNTSVVWYNPTPPVSSAYRLVANCIEFLPHPQPPDPPDPAWVPQQVLMAWFAKPTPLLLPTDTNTILEQLYGVYLWGLIKAGAVFELDDARAQQADAMSQQVITRANLWTQQSTYSGAPFTAELACRF
jgi:hypothetical protein